MIENPANKMTLKGLVVKVYGHSGYLTPPILPDVFHLGVWWCICMNTTYIYPDRLHIKKNIVTRIRIITIDLMVIIFADVGM